MNYEARAKARIRIGWMLDHWRLGFHLIFRMNRFGVDNFWWNSYDSMFGYPLWRVVLRAILVYPLIREYRFVKFRATAVYMLTPEIRNILWPEPVLGGTCKGTE